MDDTFVILQQSHKDYFFQHFNSVDHSIIFTTEETGPNGSMLNLDTLITPQKDGTLTTSVYRKSTHTDLYLQWDSHHNQACKYTVINTIKHQAKVVCSKSKLSEGEINTSRRSLPNAYIQSGPLTKCYKRKKTEE